ncbi:glycosyltransferase family 8 protein [Leuconostoc gelidum]|uniref:Glycosyltransferase family 8 protein n=1 Tax=Leuconostoc gelidum subsp. gelidum TaxID=1607839 RepID=A0AB35FXY3_LEUGE|nr:hypothetical protein [Leuconostoc gelidum subsp. gelidum]
MEHVLLSGDENVLKYLSVVMESVEKNSTALVTFHIFYPVNNKESEEILTQLGESYSIKTYGINDAILQPLTNVAGKRWPAAAFYPLLASMILPDDMDRILSLDSDTLVVGNIDNLFEIPFEGKALLATSGWISGKGEDYNPKGLNWDFNSGVYLINLAKWREMGIDISFWKSAQVKLIEKGVQTQFDQDLLNESFSIHHTKYINKAYNVNPHKYKIAMKSPEFDGRKILHFTNNADYFVGKPWDIKFEKSDVSNETYNFHYKITPNIQEMTEEWWTVAENSLWINEFLRESAIRKKAYNKSVKYFRGYALELENRRNLSGMIQGARKAMLHNMVLYFSKENDYPMYYNKSAFKKSILVNKGVRIQRLVKDNNYVVVPFFKQLKLDKKYKLVIKLWASGISELDLFIRRNHDNKQLIGNIRFENIMKSSKEMQIEFKIDREDYWDIALADNGVVNSFLVIESMDIREVL